MSQINQNGVEVKQGIWELEYPFEENSDFFEETRLYEVEVESSMDDESSQDDSE
jgi:hypothetical protein